jgi:hypothetical protein
MPKTAMDYSKTIIYKLVCNDLNVTDCYVGHTTNFVKRKYDHKSNCYYESDKCYNYKVYQTIRANGGWENWSMIQIEAYPCNNIQEATARERYYYELLKPTMNMQTPGRSDSEYRKEYKKINSETIKAKHDCECGGSFCSASRNRHFRTEKHKKYIEELTKEIN